MQPNYIMNEVNSMFRCCVSTGQNSRNPAISARPGPKNGSIPLSKKSSFRKYAGVIHGGTGGFVTTASMTALARR